MTRIVKSPTVKPAKLRRRAGIVKFRRLKGDLTGKSLIAAMQASPHRAVDLESERTPMLVREVSL